MPLYDFICPAGHRFERVVKLADFDKEQRCACGQVSQKQISAPMVQADLPGYESPIDGRWISGRAARREDLRRSGCRPYEPSERTEFLRRRSAEEAAFEARVDATVEAEVERMPVRKRERLAAELEGGMDVNIQRS